MHDLPPGFGSAEYADQHLGFAPFAPQGPVQAVKFGETYALGNPEGSFLEAMNPMYLSLGGAVVLGGIGGVLGAQKDMKTAAIAGGGAAVVGALLGYFAPSIIAKMSGK